jgi:DMSO/TMAO reductase YedYZ molybdopterin-dependent catalytic subunit
MTGPTRGFLGRRRERDARLPPGQYDVGADWPVLTAEPTPRIAPESWSITVDGRVATTTTWTWDEAHRLPPSEYRGAIHCVTTWSKTGYTTNLPLEDVTGGKAWIVWEYDGKPLPIEHGGPVRMLVPHLYFWKSAKWVTRLTLLTRDQPGFWEQNGYHDRGDPWREQRYQGD